MLELKPSFVSGITARSEEMIIYICLMTCLKENDVAGAMKGNGMDVVDWGQKYISYTQHVLKGNYG